MSAYRSMIDEALEAARARAGTPTPAFQKTASAEDVLIKEASEMANALEFVSLSAAGDHRLGGFRSEMIRDYYKTAADGGPAESAASTSGVQGQAPAAGKKKLAPQGLVGGNSPAESSASPAGKDGQKALLESFKQAEGQSLYDILMANKTAAAGGPAEFCSESEGSLTDRLSSVLGSNTGPVTAQKRALRAPTRQRLAEAFGHTHDVTSDASAAAIWPQAAAKGSLKVANAELSDALDSFLEKYAGKKSRARKARAQVMAHQNAMTAQSQMRKGVSAENVGLAHDQSQINRLAQGRGGAVASSAKPASPMSLRVSPGGAAQIEGLDKKRQAGPSVRDQKRNAFLQKREDRLGRSAARRRRLSEQMNSRKARIMERRQRNQRTHGVTGPVAPQPSLAQVMAPRTARGDASAASAARMPESARNTTVPRGVPDSAVTRAGGTPVPAGQKRTPYTPESASQRRVELNDYARRAAEHPSPAHKGGGGARRAATAPGWRRHLTGRNLAIAGGLAATGGLAAYGAHKYQQKDASLSDYFEGEY